MSVSKICDDAEGIDDLAARLGRVSTELLGVPAPLRLRTETVVQACGGFSPQPEQGAATYALSWSADMPACSAGCDLLGDNVGASSP